VYADQVAALGSTPKALAVSPRNNAIAIAITSKAMVVLDAGKVSATVPLSFPASSVSISPDGVTVAVGGDDNKVSQHPISTASALSQRRSVKLTPLCPTRSGFSLWKAAGCSDLPLSLSATAQQ
jgi:hypothetical protein